MILCPFDYNFYLLNGFCKYLQKTPYTGQCWDDSFWQELQLLFEIPASLYLASVNVKGKEDVKEQSSWKKLTLIVTYEACGILCIMSLLQICQSPWWHTGVHPLLIWQGWLFQTNLPQFSSPFRICPCYWKDWLLMLGLQKYQEKYCNPTDYKGYFLNKVIISSTTVNLYYHAYVPFCKYTVMSALARSAVRQTSISCLWLCCWETTHNPADSKKANVTDTQQIDEYRRLPYIEHTDSECTISIVL